jgi:hypothetical protein
VARLAPTLSMHFCTSVQPTAYLCRSCLIIASDTAYASAPAWPAPPHAGSAHGGMEGRLPPRVEARFAAEGARCAWRGLSRSPAPTKPHAAGAAAWGVAGGARRTGSCCARRKCTCPRRRIFADASWSIPPHLMGGSPTLIIFSDAPSRPHRKFCCQPILPGTGCKSSPRTNKSHTWCDDARLDVWFTMCQAERHVMHPFQLADCATPALLSPRRRRSLAPGPPSGQLAPPRKRALSSSMARSSARWA